MANNTTTYGDERRHAIIITNMDIVSPLITGVNKKPLKIKVNDIK
jgi:hypothetical protein